MDACVCQIIFKEYNIGMFKFIILHYILIFCQLNQNVVLCNIAQWGRNLQMHVYNKLQTIVHCVGHISALQQLELTWCSWCQLLNSCL